MSDINTGGPAFPVPMFSIGHAKYEAQQQGLTLRDYFAAKALQSVVGWVSTRSETLDYHQCAKSAYGIADAMLKARAA